MWWVRCGYRARSEKPSVCAERSRGEKTLPSPEVGRVGCRNHPQPVSMWGSHVNSSVAQIEKQTPNYLILLTYSNVLNQVKRSHLQTISANAHHHVCLELAVSMFLFSAPGEWITLGLGIFSVKCNFPCSACP